jgi:hypothetical protein
MTTAPDCRIPERPTCSLRKGEDEHILGDVECLAKCFEWVGEGSIRFCSRHELLDTLRLHWSLRMCYICSIGDVYVELLIGGHLERMILHLLELSRKLSCSSSSWFALQVIVMFMFNSWHGEKLSVLQAMWKLLMDSSIHDCTPRHLLCRRAFNHQIWCCRGT